MTNPRIVATTKLAGMFPIPLGLRFLSREVGEWPKSVTVSTVNLEDGHLEDPTGSLDPEHGFETMVFLDGCSFFSVLTRSYKTRGEAEAGHAETVVQILAGEAKLSVQLPNYIAHEAVDAKAA